jgi:hypothetical protein
MAVFALTNKTLKFILLEFNYLRAQWYSSFNLNFISSGSQLSEQAS